MASNLWPHTPIRQWTVTKSWYRFVAILFLPLYASADPDRSGLPSRRSSPSAPCGSTGVKLIVKGAEGALADQFGAPIAPRAAEQHAIDEDDVLFESGSARSATDPSGWNNRERKIYADPRSPITVVTQGSHSIHARERLEETIGWVDAFLTAQLPHQHRLGAVLVEMRDRPTTIRIDPSSVAELPVEDPRNPYRSGLGLLIGPQRVEGLALNWDRSLELEAVGPAFSHLVVLAAIGHSMQGGAGSDQRGFLALTSSQRLLMEALPNASRIGSGGFNQVFRDPRDQTSAIRMLQEDWDGLLSEAQATFYARARWEEAIYRGLARTLLEPVTLNGERMIYVEEPLSSTGKLNEYFEARGNELRVLWDPETTVQVGELREAINLLTLPRDSESRRMAGLYWLTKIPRSGVGNLEHRTQHAMTLARLCLERARVQLPGSAARSGWTSVVEMNQKIWAVEEVFRRAHGIILAASERWHLTTRSNAMFEQLRAQLDPNRYRSPGPRSIRANNLTVGFDYGHGQLIWDSVLRIFIVGDP